jgi:hypothetical protein
MHGRTIPQPWPARVLRLLSTRTRAREAPPPCCAPAPSMPPPPHAAPPPPHTHTCTHPTCRSGCCRAPPPPPCPGSPPAPVPPGWRCACAAQVGAKWRGAAAVGRAGEPVEGHGVEAGRDSQSGKGGLRAACLRMHKCACRETKQARALAMHRRSWALSCSQYNTHAPSPAPDSYARTHTHTQSGLQGQRLPPACTARYAP